MLLYDEDLYDDPRGDELAERDATEAWVDRLADQAPPAAWPALQLDRIAGDIAAARGVPEVGSC